MTILKKHEIATPSFVELLQGIEEFQAQGYKISYESTDCPAQYGNLFVVYMVLEGEEEAVAEKPANVTPKTTPAKAPAKKAV